MSPETGALACILIVLLIMMGVSRPVDARSGFIVPAVPFEDGTGLEDDPWQVATAEQLASMQVHPKGHFILIADIDLNPFPFNFQHGWVPIGDGQAPFRGTFDGDGHTISNLFISRGAAYQGLFGYTEQAVIRNVILEKADVTGSVFVGGLVGHADISTTITRCLVDGSVSGDFFIEGRGDGISIGGLAGSTSRGSRVVNSHSSANVRGDTNVGGLVGHNDEASVIVNSSASGHVRGGFEVGGLVGRNSAASEIIRSFATGNVVGETVVGGLVGELDALLVENSYATGSVVGINSVGGLVGAGTAPEILNSYAAGEVRGEAEGHAGGLVGASSDAGRITGSFWDVDASGVEESAGGEGKTTEEMRAASSFADADWDFERVWAIGEGETYPRLQWQSDDRNNDNNDNDPWNDHHRSGCFMGVL